jgi:hypothetical protein
MGGGRIETTPSGSRLILPPCSASRYSDAQLDDYAGLPRRLYPHRPPLRLSLRARFSHEGTYNFEMAEDFLTEAVGNRRSPHTARSETRAEQDSLTGTAGFGFWNNPFGPQSKLPALPQAIWFFYASPPSNMALARDVPGSGWKAACIDAGRAAALAWSPLALPIILLCRWPRLYRAIWPRAQRALAISETPLYADMTDWHTYELEWRRDGARWSVDGEAQLETDRAPRGPLGFVVWIDNQYAVITPQGKFGFGTLDAPFEQWVELADLKLTKDERR